MVSGQLIAHMVKNEFGPGSHTKYISAPTDWCLKYERQNDKTKKITYVNSLNLREERLLYIRCKNINHKGNDQRLWLHLRWELVFITRQPSEVGKDICNTCNQRIGVYFIFLLQIKERPETKRIVKRWEKIFYQKRKHKEMVNRLKDTKTAVGHFVTTNRYLAWWGCGANGTLKIATAGGINCDLIGKHYRITLWNWRCTTC